MLKKLQKNGKKGFTLVELIVVLVILAILAALLVPALTGYIDKAKQKQVIAETRQSVMAAQTITDELYAKNTADLADTVNTKTADIRTLADVPGTVSNDIEIDAKGHITKLVYTNTSAGLKCEYTYNDTTKVGTYGDPTAVTP